ncbi:MAG: cation diffusion facilitator family transporter [Candidatus Omnitrophica bacterium]|nr:cation diffusion facilitator family transporter [Candidatus Omnitrophota bacterium]
MSERYSNIRRILFVVLALNWAVALGKIIYGFLSRCESMTADGFHSFSDGTSNIIGLIGIHFASQPKDTEHPYGHKKYETFFSLVIAFSLFVLAFNLIKNSIGRFFNPVIPKIDMNNFVVMFLTLFINFWVMYYEKKRGMLLKSDILVSDAMHTKADILTSLCVIIAFFFIRAGYPVMDQIVTIFISLFILHAGYDIAKKSSDVLCDTAALLDIKQIEDIVLKVKGVKACHKIRTRGRSDDIHIDLHVQVNPVMHMEDAHKISYAIEAEIKKQLPQITDVVVHMEPK